jgi:hypothetical protein
MSRWMGAMGRKHTFISNQRGAVALEAPFVYILLFFGLMLPLVDVAVAGFQYISAIQALRSFGQTIQYSPPSDVTNASGWISTETAKADPKYPVSTINLICGDSNTACSSGNSSPPMYYSYSTTITLSPMVLGSLLCGSSCIKTLSYSQRFQ